MAGDEDEAQEIVANVIVDRGVEIGLRRLLLNLELITELLMFAFEQLVAAEDIDRPMLRGGHEPGARLIRNARLGPLFKRRNESVLRQLLREANVAYDPRKTGDELGLLDPEYCLNRAMGVGSRHGYRLTQLP